VSLGRGRKEGWRKREGGEDREVGRNEGKEKEGERGRGKNEEREEVRERHI